MKKGKEKMNVINLTKLTLMLSLMLMAGTVAAGAEDRAAGYRNAKLVFQAYTKCVVGCYYYVETE